MVETACPPRLTYRAAARTHAGRVRQLNEDRLLVRTDAGLWAVADGMGGHQAGDLAATRLIEALAELKARGAGYQRLRALEQAVQQVNAELYSSGSGGEAGRDRSTSGATLVALLAHEGHFACVWAGDSRAYRLREGRLEQVTRDHTVVQALIDRGEIAEEQRKTHPKVHMVTRAVGAAGALTLEQRFAPIEASDSFLLCSDGLTACVTDAEIATRLQRHDLEATADDLVDLALERGAPDNLSFVLVAAEAART